ncbi:MAG: hypothetical protein RLZZ226_1664 [Pseudomonadota bacterium]|jgi:hypothetical protein
MTKKSKKTKTVWVWAPCKSRVPKPSLPDHIEAASKTELNHWIETVLKPAYLTPPPGKLVTNHLIDFRIRCYRHYFYLQGLYQSPFPQPPSPFLVNLARIEYLMRGGFSLSYAGSNPKWFEVSSEISLRTCMTKIQEADWLFG